MTDNVSLEQLAASLANVSRQLDALLQLSRSPLGFLPDRLRATRVQIRRNSQLGPDSCLQVWDPAGRKLMRCPTNTIKLFMSNVRSQSAQGGGKTWDELIISGFAGPQTGWVDLVCTLGGITSDAIMASLLGMSDQELSSPLIFNFRPAEDSDSVVLVRVGNLRNQWADPNPQRQVWQKNSRGMLEALQEKLRRVLAVSELPHESFIRANRRLRYDGFPANLPLPSDQLSGAG